MKEMRLVADPRGKAFLSSTQIDMIQQAFAHDLHASHLLKNYLGFCVLGICKATLNNNFALRSSLQT